MLRLNGQKVAEFVPEIADNLTTDDSTKALSAKQGKVLNESTTWKIVGSASGTSEINLPQTWKELVAQIRYNGVNINTHHLYNIQTDNLSGTSFGNYGTSYAIGQISKTKIRMSSVNWAGTDVTASAILYVYYR